MKSKYNKACLLFIANLLLMSAACSSEKEKEQPLRNVILTEVNSLNSTAATVYPGIVEEGGSISASFMADGKISGINVKEGDRVRKGQLLATLDDTDYRIGVTQLETQFKQMTAEKERMDAMFEKHNIAPNDYEKFIAGYEQLKLQLDLAHRQLDYTKLYSPANGYISNKYMQPGELAGAGTPIFNIIDDSELRANVDLPVQVYLEKERIVSAKGSVPGISDEIPLKIISITPDADNTMLYRMKLAIPSQESKALTSGMNISVALITSEAGMTETLVPSRALFKKEDKNYVWLFNPADSTISGKSVIIEGAPQGKMSVVKGLQAGELIVETGVRQLYEGEKVNVLNRNSVGL